MRTSLYVHIPFCDEKCDYCDFYSLGSGSGYQKRDFIRVLIDHLAFFCEEFQIDEFPTVYIGGGTPTSLSSKLLEPLFAAIDACSKNSPIEWTLEVNPESLTRDHLSLFSSFPVSRISMGVQSLYEPSRKFIGRRGSIKAVLKAFDLLHDYWKGALSIDLIRGLSDNASLSLEDELSRLPLSSIQHLSLYDLTVEKGTPLSYRVRKSDPRLDNLPQSLKSSGFQHYEVSNYARPGKESRHNQSYWDMEPYLGIGPGAVSLIRRNGLWMQHSVRRNLDYFLRRSPGECIETESPSAAEFFIDHLLMGFRQVKGLSLNRVQERFAQELSDIIPETLSCWADNLSLDSAGDRLALTGAAFWIQDRFFLDAWKEIDAALPFA
ncbi:radical SAM family heme chaperone HemW [Marispirochaeta sp.]|uniref:radical SAM family heme chaperone HemW n=1 Tax=Marispirochaeta sp. TaxID=2038653 RepID=UPI0029C8694A|nr:radical SAM family heme chaperone HemW [Marispirochaeta sp.]